MSNLEILKQLENIYPRWIVTKNHCYMPMTMSKEDGHIIYDQTWEYLSREEITEMYETCVKWSKGVKMDLEGKINNVNIDNTDYVEFSMLVGKHPKVELRIPKDIYEQELKYKK